MKELLYIIQLYQRKSLKTITKEYNNTWTEVSIGICNINNRKIITCRHLNSRLRKPGYYIDYQIISNFSYIETGRLPKNYV